MSRFSERYGYREVRTALQQESMDTNLRTDIWNIIHLLNRDTPEKTESHRPYFRIWASCWREPLDEIPRYTVQMSPMVKKFIMSTEWHQVYDLVETYVESLNEKKRPTAIDAFNRALELNLSAYRIVDQVVAKIDEDTDIEAIEQALEDARDITGARRHLRQALSLLADREAPDYANSIKESVSAIEAVARHLTGSQKSTLGDALKALKSSGLTLHPALEKSWLSAYGYTSDADGIRHALTDESTVDQARARYFLVTSSAFVSLLLHQAQSVGIPPRDDQTS